MYLARRQFARASTILVTGALVSCAAGPLRLPTDSEIRASRDPQLIERGRYLVYGPAHCASCHGDPAREEDLLRSKEVPLSGGRRFDLGVLGVVFAPNITSDGVAGIGGVSDDALVRALRYGVSHSGRPLAPFMPFADLADRDLRAIISFLRAAPPAAGAPPKNDLSWFGALAINFFLEPQGPQARPPELLEPERTAKYGRYLAHTVANCHGCHTRRSKLTGAFNGEPFAGGMKFIEQEGEFVAPNLTPVPEGVLAGLSEQAFVQRFRTRAELPSASPMPWAAFARMTEEDLGAIYRYLMTLPPTPTPSGQRTADSGQRTLQAPRARGAHVALVCRTPAPDRG